MASTTVQSGGISLPYSSLFNVNVSVRQQSKRLSKPRPADYFWNQATKGSISKASPQANASQLNDVAWLEIGEPAFSDSEDDSPPEYKEETQKARRIPRLTKLRQIAFKAFTPKSNGTGSKNNIVKSTEILSHREIKIDSPTQKTHASRPISILSSWKFKSKRGSKTEVRKMVAVLKDRISASSPLELHPKTWEEYDRFYSEERIDVHNPPLPPMNPAPEAFKSRFYKAPKHKKENIRQLVVNRLGVFGDKHFDPTEEGAAKSKARTEIGDKLLEEGHAPSLLEEAWEPNNADTSIADIGNTSPPETLEQHPVFRKIVKQCRELFGTALGVLSIFDDDRQVLLAESGFDGIREISREISFCAHGILSGRKGFTILDTHKDWRFENCPLVQNLGSRFYAGVPLMAPNLDGSKESEVNTCPIGTLCVVDSKPRTSFSIEDRKKLVYMSEYARREIGNWFAKKMQHKISHLGASQEVWNLEKNRIGSDETFPLSDGSISAFCTSTSNQRNLINLRRSGSLSTAPTSPSSYADISIKSPITHSAGLLGDLNVLLKPKTRQLFDLATKLVADTLDLPFVYLAAVIPSSGESSDSGQTTILSGNNIPLPVPTFDTDLHLRALRTPEGGLLYQNPSLRESEQAGLQPKMSGSGKRANPYASALLLAVGTEPQLNLNSGGFVLAGYTDDPKRVFGAEDVVYMKQFAHELSRSTFQLLT